MNIVVMAGSYSDPSQPGYLRTYQGSFLPEILIEQIRFPSTETFVVLHPDDEVLYHYLSSNYQVKLIRQASSHPFGSLAVLDDIIGDCIILTGSLFNTLQSDIEKFINSSFMSALCRYKNPWHSNDVCSTTGLIRRSDIGASIVKITDAHKKTLLSLENLAGAKDLYRIFTGKDLGNASFSDIETYLLYTFFFAIWSDKTTNEIGDLGSIFIDHDIYSRVPEDHVKSIFWGSKYSGKTLKSISDNNYIFRKLGQDDSSSIVDIYDQILEEVAPIGKVLGVGESASKTSIFNYPYFIKRRLETECVGINIDKSGCGINEHFRIFYGTSHAIQYPSDHFDCVISCMHLEHDPKFWLSLLEMKRVLKTDGIFYVAVPAFVSDDEYTLDEMAIGGHRGNGTITYELHGNPDCYRFSPHWITTVAFPSEEFSDVIVTLAKVPPRLIITGRKRRATNDDKTLSITD